MSDDNIDTVGEASYELTAETLAFDGQPEETSDTDSSTEVEVEITPPTLDESSAETEICIDIFTVLIEVDDYQEPAVPLEEITTLPEDAHAFDDQTHDESESAQPAISSLNDIAMQPKSINSLHSSTHSLLSTRNPLAYDTTLLPAIIKPQFIPVQPAQKPHSVPLIIRQPSRNTQPSAALLAYKRELALRVPKPTPHAQRSALRTSQGSPLQHQSTMQVIGKNPYSAKSAYERAPQLFPSAKLSSTQLTIDQVKLGVRVCTPGALHYIDMNAGFLAMEKGAHGFTGGKEVAPCVARGVYAFRRRDVCQIMSAKRL